MQFEENVFDVKSMLNICCETKILIAKAFIGFVKAKVDDYVDPQKTETLPADR